VFQKKVGSGDLMRRSGGRAEGDVEEILEDEREVFVAGAIQKSPRTAVESSA